MLRELLKWLQGIGAGGLVELLHYFQGLPPDGVLLHVAIVAGIVRLLGYLVSKIPASA